MAIFCWHKYVEQFGCLLTNRVGYRCEKCGKYKERRMTRSESDAGWEIARVKLGIPDSTWRLINESALHS